MQTNLLEAPAEFEPVQSPPCIVIDEQDLRDLIEQKVFPKESWFYLAIKLDYPEDNPTIDIHSFCVKWEIKPGEFDILVAKLAKKNVWMKKPERYVQLMLNFPAEED
jgi:hypothetical protein